MDARVVGMQVVGCRVGKVAGLAGSLVICLKSSWMVPQGCGSYLLRNLWLQRVILPDPSTHTIYWSNWWTSMMAPLVPLVGMWICLVLNTYMVADCKRW